MNSSNISFPCTLGDRIRDNMTGIEGMCAGFKVQSDGSKAVCIAWNSHGDPRYLWIKDNRVEAGRTPEQIAADAASAAADARRVIEGASAAHNASGDASAGASTGASTGAGPTEDDVMDARQPEQPQPRARGHRRARSEGAAEAEQRRREGGQQ